MGGIEAKQRDKESRTEFSGVMASETGNEERRKVALDALERRLALAENDLLQQQQQQKQLKRKQQRPIQEKPKLNDDNIIIFNSSVNLIATSDLPFTKQGLEANDPTYFPLYHPVHENIASTSVEILDKKGSVADKILHELLQNGDAAQKYMLGSKGKKMDNWILLDNLVQGSSTHDRARIKALNSNSKRSKKHMSKKQHKKYGSFSLPDKSRKFEIYKPMHEMWQTYITQLLKNVGKDHLAQRLLNAYLHGALILVVQSKIASLIGVSGIMIRETAETFSVITTDNKLHVVVKKASVFMLKVDCWKITLLGDELRSRNTGP